MNNIQNELDGILTNQKQIEMKIFYAKKELKTFIRDKKRAKSNIAKDSIQQENIEPIYKKMRILRSKNETLSMQLLAIESNVLEEELKTRKSGTTTVTKLDNKYRLKFLFSRLRRFGNFTGYLSGRKEEADNTIKNYLIKRMVSEYIRSNGKDNLYSEYGIDSNSETALNDLREKIIAEKIGDLDEKLSEFKSEVINENNVYGSVDRRKMLSKLIKNVPKRTPSTPFLDSYNNANNDGPEHEEDAGER